MMPLFFMERLILESLVRQTKDEVALAQDTSIAREALDFLLDRLAQRGLIIQDAEGIHTNLTARDKLISILSGPQQRQMEVQDLLIQLGHKHLKHAALRSSWHLKKVYLTQGQILNLLQLLQQISEIFDYAAQQNVPHALHEEYVFAWAAGRCADMVQDVSQEKVSDMQEAVALQQS